MGVHNSFVEYRYKASITNSNKTPRNVTYISCLQFTCLENMIILVAECFNRILGERMNIICISSDSSVELSSHNILQPQAVPDHKHHRACETSHNISSTSYINNIVRCNIATSAVAAAATSTEVR